MSIPKGIPPVLSQLSTDKNIFTECPYCSESFSLSKAGLFFGNEFTPEAELFIQAKQDELKQIQEDFKKAKEKATTGAAKKSTEVNFGKVLEKVAPALCNFPFVCTDCRPIFEPIDYLAFKGWTEKGRVEELCFIDIKTGNARLNTHQQQVKSAVENGKVELQVY